jgi:hypothetical protein
MSDSSSGRTWPWGALFFGWFVFYWLTAPAVHIEADDAYEYAHSVEAASFYHLVHPYHPLYLVLMRAVFVLGRSMGLVDRSFDTMLVLGAGLAAAAVVLFSLVLWQRIGISRARAFVAGGLLGFSYGFWRYAAEAETYALGSLLVLVLVWGTFAQRISIRRAALGGVLGLLAMFGHVLNVIPALVSAPLYLALRYGKKHAMVYLAVFLLSCVPAVYAIGTLAQVAYPHYATTQLPERQSGLDLQRSDAVNATMVFGHVVATGNFLFSFPEFRAWLGERYPKRRVEGEQLLGIRAGPRTGVLGSVTLLMAMIAFGWTLGRGVFRGRPSVSDPIVLTTLVWLTLYAVTIWYMDNLEQPEAWLLALVPFWLLFVRLVHVESRLGTGILFVCVLPAALLLHNTIGGMAMLNDSASDRHQLKASWLLENADEKDIILTSESAGFSRYLRYYSSADVVSLHLLGAAEVVEIYDEAVRHHGRVFVTGEVVQPPGFMQRAPEAWMSDSGGVIGRFQASTRQVHRDDWGGVYLLEALDAPTDVGKE